LTSGNLARAIGEAIDNTAYRSTAAAIAAALRARNGIAEMAALAGKIRAG
jgi:UDP:flavonoid glycosyltransferase YjiC (YdhE family)